LEHFSGLSKSLFVVSQKKKGEIHSF